VRRQGRGGGGGGGRTDETATSRWPATGTSCLVRRRMVAGRAMPAGSSRALRLDPCALPVSFTTGDARADERLRSIELDRERVVGRRQGRGGRQPPSLQSSPLL